MSDPVAPPVCIRDVLEGRWLPDSDTARLDVELLLAHVLGKDRVYLFTWPERPLSDTELTTFNALLERRKQGVPVAYLVGRRSFWSLDLSVSPSTLIPRADTELLVECALEVLGSECEPGTDCIRRVLDLGTGTGAVALAIAVERPQIRVFGVDFLEEVVQLAQKNAAAHQIENCEFLVSDWFDQLRGASFDMIVSNPPYIRASDVHLGQGDVAHEPRSALVAGPDGLDDLRRIIGEAPDHLENGGWLMVEHGFDQGASVRALFERSGFCSVNTRKDLSGNDRVTRGKKR